MEYEYWLWETRAGDPGNLYRIAKPKLSLVEVWHKDEWLPTSSSRAEFSGLGGDAQHRLIPDDLVDDLIPKFMLALNQTPPV